MEEVSLLRLYAMRALFLLNFVFVGTFASSALIRHAGSWDPVRGVAYSFWAALALLSGLGIRHPLKMLPLLLMQLAYKTIWLVAVYVPNGSDGGSGLFPVMAGGVIADLAIVPWTYAWSAYVRTPGNRWR